MEVVKYFFTKKYCAFHSKLYVLAISTMFFNEVFLTHLTLYASPLHCLNLSSIKTKSVIRDEFLRK